jgi:BirA family biotin operon repressor/biotin-[acetyl-CoA-carboxylase] ligase
VTVRLHYFERVGSTMDVVHQLAADGAPAGTAVLAGEQLEGRGSRGRAWHSPPGGLWLSVLCRPRAINEGLEVISLRTGLAVAEAVQELVAEPLMLKWPNDLMLRGRKVGGLLCEARWQGAVLGWVALGVGINVRNQIPHNLQSIAVALAAVQPEITIDELAGPLIAALTSLDLGAGPLSPSELMRFSSIDWLRGLAIRKPVAGTARGLADDGSLLVRNAAGDDIPLRSGSVELAEPPTAGNFDHAPRTRHR